MEVGGDDFFERIMLAMLTFHMSSPVELFF